MGVGRHSVVEVGLVRFAGGMWHVGRGGLGCTSSDVEGGERRVV